MLTHNKVLGTVAKQRVKLSVVILTYRNHLKIRYSAPIISTKYTQLSTIMVAQIFFELRGIATLRITLTYHFLALCGAVSALAVVIPAEVKDMGWSKAFSMVAMLAVIIGLLAHIIVHRESETTHIHSLLY
jgi:hypothetical protein